MTAAAAMWAMEAAWMELKIDGTVTIVGSLEVNLDAIRHEAANADAPEHGVMPRSAARS